MAFTLGLNQIALLQEAKDRADLLNESTGGYSQAYEILFSMTTVDEFGFSLFSEFDAETAFLDLNTFFESYDPSYDEKFSSSLNPIDGVDRGAWIFLRGVSEVNWAPEANPDPTANTTYSEFIRAYTNHQYLIRFGEELHADGLQSASDLIAESILQDIFDSNGSIPDIDTIATRDAAAAAQIIFLNGQISGWAGNALLLPVGHDESYRTNILNQGGAGNTLSYDTYDILAVVESIKTASAEVGFGATGLIFDVLLNVVGEVPGAADMVIEITDATEAHLDAAYGTATLIPWNTLIDFTFLTNINLGTKDSDIIAGANGDDLVHGGAGNDVLVVSGGDDLLDGGEGTDAVDYRLSTDAITVDLRSNLNGAELDYTGRVTRGNIIFPGKATDELFNIEEIIGSSFDDSFVFHGGKTLLIDGDQGHDVVDYRFSFRARELDITWDGVNEVVRTEDSIGSVNELYNIEEIIGAFNGINTLELLGAGDFEQGFNGEYFFNGQSLILPELSRIEGDGSDQNFILTSMPVDGVYGGGGDDTLTLAVSGGISNQITGDFYQDQLLLPINAYTDIDDVNFTGTPTTLVVDPYENGAVLERGYNDYSASNDAAEFVLGAYTDIDALDFNGLNYAFRQLFYTAVDTGFAQQYGDGYSDSGSGSRSSIYHSARHDHTVGVAHFRGTDHGDDVLIRSDNFLPTDIDFVAGYGDDAIDVGYSRPGGSASVTYTKGNDTISGGYRAITDIKMWSAIRPSDVSISGDVITVNGYGTITLQGISAADIAINFLGTEKAATIEGSWSSESWTGHDVRDEIFYGLGGDDVLNGNGGQDNIYGGTGNDTLYSLKGANVLEGGLDDDIYYVSKNALTTVIDQFGDNVLYASDFNKEDVRFVMNTEGMLVVEDSAGNAVLSINPGGNFDHIEFQNSETLTLSEALAAAEGSTATYNATEGRDAVYGRGADGEKTSVELKGGNDVFYGSSYSVSETVYGGDGREFMLAGLGDDTLYGGKGDDYHLNGEEGNDYIDGGEGRDTYILTDYMQNGQSSGHGGSVDLSLGIAYDDGLGGTDTLVSIEGVRGTQYDDLIIGDNENNHLLGEEGNDTLYGKGGDDSFEFEDYNTGDSAFIDGGAGSDRLYYGHLEDYRIVADLGAGIVSENGRGGQDIIVSIENIVGSALGGDHITGSDERNEIYLAGFYGEGSTALGMGGDDIIYGSYYDDTLSGGDGIDVLLGHDGNDTLIGGAGNDTLEGGAGDDTYIFAAGDGIDIIRDTEGENILVIEGDIALDDLVTTRKGNDLILHIASGVTFENYYESEPADNAFTLSFTDGTQIDAKAVEVNNAAPVAQDDAFDLLQNSSVTGNVLYDNGYGEDADPDADTIEVVAGAFVTEFGGTLQLSEDGSFTYTPEQDFSGFDTVSYSITDGYEGTDTAEVSFFVGSVNTGPEANDDDVAAEEDTAITIDVLANDNDVDGDILSVSIEGSPLNGSVVINADQTITYTPDDNYNGDDSFTYGVDDGHGGTDSAIVSLSVSAVNDNPIAQNDTVNTQYNQSLLLTAAQLIANDSDIENDALEIASAHNAQNGAVVLNSDGSVSFTPDTNFSGAASFEYTLSDGNGGTSTASVNVAVSSPPDNNDVLYGTEGDDNLFGTRENDIIEAKGGDDRVFARSGNDEVHGGSGNDWLFGGNGDDLLYGNDGDDFLFGQRGSNEMSGGAGDDLIAGSSDRDVLSGESGDDLLLGNNGNDVLDGGQGSDRLYGGRGDDLLFFGEGADYLYGGSGRDVFKAIAADAIESATIRDFDAREDVLDISDILTGYDPIADVLSDFVNVEASRSRATVYVDRDGAGTEHGWEQLIQMQVKGASNLNADEDHLVNDGVLVI